jgi:hypothetical protein
MLKIDWLRGNCPVQAEGTFDGEPFYFRARYTSWRVEVGEWECGALYREDSKYGAGWMSEKEARAFIEQAYALWKVRNDFS